MLIPSIDIMGGKIVQLVQGERKAFETDDVLLWVQRFSQHRLVQLIDLDAAMGRAPNSDLMAKIAAELPCQIGGGVRSVERARELIAGGAQRVIVGSSLISNGEINREFAEELAAQVGRERLAFAVDSRGGKVAVQGWKENTLLEPAAMMHALEHCCAAFLYTHIDTEGCMTGFPMDVAKRLRDSTARQLIVAGGIASLDEVAKLGQMGVDAVIGMAIYTGAIDPDHLPR